MKTRFFPIEKDDLIIVNPHLSHTEISNGISPLSYFTVGVDGISFFNDHRDFQIFNCRKQKDLLFYFNAIFQELDKRQKDTKASVCTF